MSDKSRGLRIGSARPTRRGVEGLEERQLLTAVALIDSYKLIQDNPLSVAAGGVLANDVIASGNPLSVASHTATSHGSLTLNADGSFLYAPSAGYSGMDAFGYTVDDGQGHTASSSVSLDIAASPAGATLFAGPRLASVSTAQSPLLNATLGSLLGTNLSLSALDWNAIAAGQVNGLDVANALKAELGVASTSQALAADATVAQVVTAAATAATAEGDTALATALGDFSAQVGGLAGTIKLGDLIQIDPNDGSLADASLNALDLATGTVQLFNFRNVATTPAPVTVSGAALGLSDVLNSVQLSAQVVEPPVYMVAAVGSTFHTSAVRLKLNVDLVDLTPSTSSLVSVLSSLGTVQADATIGQVQLYTEVAEGTGVVSAIDAITHAVTLQATPGVADVYLGQIADSTFFDRTHALNPATDLGYADVGTLHVKVSVPILGTVLADSTTTIQARSVGLGQAPFASTLTFNPPFPNTQTDSTSAAFVSNLASSLVTNLQVQLGGSLGALLDPLVNGTILPALKPIVANAVAPALGSVLAGVADPALQGLGVGLGELVVTIDGVAQHAPPRANDDVAQTPEEQAKVLTVLDNDARVVGDTLTISSLTQPAHGTASAHPDGTITYTPSALYRGPDSFTYTISNGVNGTSMATVSLTVTPVNHAPTANPDAYATPEEAPLTVAATGVLGNDTDPDGDPLTAILVTGPAHGTLTLNANGSFVYTPVALYRGPDSFTYRASDGLAQSGVATVSLTVTPVNHAPTANPDAYTTAEEAALTIAAPGILGNDTDPDGDILTAALVVGPAHGSLTLRPDGSFLYTPDALYRGPDGFTYRTSDGLASSGVATVSLTVTPVNHPPTANPDSYATAAGTTLAVSGPGVLANDTDPDGNPLTALLASGPAHGSVALSADGSLVYTPAAGYVGPDSFSYRASDGTATSPPATVSLTVSAVDHAPTANPDAYVIGQGGTLTVVAPGVLGNDTDQDGNPLSAVGVTQPLHGSLTFSTDGSLVYTPTAGYVGPDSFTYRASDGTLQSGPATVALTVTAANQPPLANPDAYTTAEEATLRVPAGGGVLANDTDADGNPLTARLVSSPTHGTLSIAADGSFLYTPNALYRGPDSFSYRAFDGVALSAAAVVSLTVTPVDHAPVANPDAYTVQAGSILTVPAAGVLANDTDADGAPLTSALVASPAHGALTLAADGSFVYTPDALYAGPDSFSYRATDGTLASASATVSIIVAPINHPPTAVPDAYTVAQGSTLSVAAPGVLANDTDADGDPLAAAVLQPPSHGALSMAANGSLVYTPDPSYRGFDSFTYRASDGKALSAPTTVTLAVTPVNHPPSAVADAYAVAQGSTLSVAAPGVLANDTDADGDLLTAVVLQPPAHGALTLAPNGSLVYTPDPSYRGPDSFTYRASDGKALSASATVSLTVAPVDHAPVAVADAYSVAAGTSLAVPAPGVLSNDHDPDGDPIGAFLVTAPAHGVVALNADGSLRYTPAPGYVGPDSFAYRDTDGTLQSPSAVVSVFVAAQARPPVGADDAYSTPPSGVLTVAAPGVLANDNDPDGRPLSAVVMQPPAHGTLTLGPDGGFAYSAFPGFVGSDEFTYRPVDSAGAGAAVVARIVVVPATPVDASGPRILAIRRFGYHNQPTIYTLTFDRALDAASADNLANYTLRGAGRDARFGTADDSIIPLRSATYDPATHMVTLATGGTVPIRPTYEIQIKGTGAGSLTDDALRPLDGQGDGRSGTNYVGVTTQADLAGPSVAPAHTRSHGVAHPHGRRKPSGPPRTKPRASAAHRPAR